MSVDKIGQSAETDDAVIDLTEQTVSLCVRKCDLDGRLEREAPTYMGASDSMVT